MDLNLNSGLVKKTPMTSNKFFIFSFASTYSSGKQGEYTYKIVLSYEAIKLKYKFSA